MSIQDSAATETGNVPTAVTLQSLTAQSVGRNGISSYALAGVLALLAVLGLGVWRRRRTVR